MQGIFWVILSIFMLASSLAFSQGKRAFTASFLSAFACALFLCYIDKDTKSISALFQPAMLFIALMYTFTFQGVITIARHFALRGIKAYSTLALVSLAGAVIAFLNTRAHTSAIVLVWTLIFFASLSLLYFVNARVETFLVRKHI